MTKKCLKMFNNIRWQLFTILFGCLFILSSSAAIEFKEHFVYLKSDEVNLRTGPNKSHSIKWVIKNKCEPLKATLKFEQWLKVKDIDGDEGWLLDSLVTSVPQCGIITNNKLVMIYKRPDTNSKKIVRLEKNLRVRIQKCNEDAWCYVSIKDFKGWIQSKYLWGVTLPLVK